MQLRVAVVALIACSNQKPPPPPPPMQVPAAALAETEILDATEYLAQLRSRTAPAIKPQVEGQITAIYVKPGDVVDAGTPLMRIDPARQSAAVAQTQAAAGARRAALELAQQNLARVSELVAKGALAQQELDNARAAEATARGDAAAVGAELRGSRVQLGYYQITAPTHGVVGDIPVRVGDRVTTAMQVTSVADISVLEANVSIPVDRARDARIGTEVRILGDANGNANPDDGAEAGKPNAPNAANAPSAPNAANAPNAPDAAHAPNAPIAVGRVTFIAPEVSPETQSVLVKADIDNAAGLLRADQIVRARVVWRTRRGLAVPALAVSWVGGQPFVFVVENGGGAGAGSAGAGSAASGSAATGSGAGGHTIARQRPVRLGELADRTYPVVSGLKPGERIVTGGVQKLRDGAPIAVRG